MTQAILNPVKLQSLLPLLPAEEKFARCLGEGKPCQVGNGKLPKPEGRIESGSAANVVRPEVIRFFAHGGDPGKRPVRASVIDLQGAWISGDLDLTHASIPCALLFGNCHFAGSVRMQHAECKALYMDGSHLAKKLKADGLTTKGDVHLRADFSAEGEVRLLGANIGGNLDCGGGKFSSPNECALAADRLTVKSHVFMGDGFSAEGEVRLLGASIGGDLSCVGGKFHNSNPKKCALNADGLTAKGSVHMSGGFSAEGGVRLLGANIGGTLECVGGKFHNPNGNALSADELTTKGNAYLCDGFSAEGGVRLLGANIGGMLECGNGKFHNPNGDALFADGLTTKSGVHLRKGFSAEGGVRLLGANIGGNLSCNGGKFCNPNGHALSADGLTTKDSVLLHEDFSAEGGVRLLNANIGGNLNCEGGKFHNPNGRALAAENARIGGSLLWRKMKEGKGVVNLAYVRAGVLADDLDSWKPFEVILNGFTYGQFFNPADAQSRIEWLANRPAGVPFSPLPYEQAAKVLRAMGKDIDAWDIEREKNRLQRESDGASLIRKLGGWFLDTLKDAVYRPLRTVKWAASVVALGVAVFAFADYHGNIVPIDSVVALSDDYKGKVVDSRPTRAVPPEYPAFNPVVFSLDVFTPAAVFHQEDSWGPRSGGGDWLSPEVGVLWLLTGWYWLQVAAGWVLVPLFVLSVTGVLRPRQSSGEKG